VKLACRSDGGHSAPRSSPIDYRLAPEHHVSGCGRRRARRHTKPSCNRAQTLPTSSSRRDAAGVGRIATLVNARRSRALPCRQQRSSCPVMPISPLPARACRTKQDRRRCYAGKAAGRVPLHGRRDAGPGDQPRSPDLSGLAPLIIQAGTHEVLRDDEFRLAGQGRHVTSRSHSTHPGVPHVPGYHG